MSRNIKDIITSTKFVAAAVVSKVTLITAAKRYGGTGRYTEGNQLSESKKIFNAIFLAVGIKSLRPIYHPASICRDPRYGIIFYSVGEIGSIRRVTGGISNRSRFCRILN